MQGSPPSNILRNSYGYQIVDPPPMRSPNGKPYQLPAHYSLLNQQESSIKQLENKLEGLAVKKSSQLESNYLSQPALREAPEGRFKGPHPFAPEEPLSEQMLRGSCQNFIRKFDYTALRNTTHFNPLAKPSSTHNELRRSPAQEDPHRAQNHHANRTLAQEPSNTFLRPNEKKLLENKHSFLANNPSKSPPQLAPEKHPEEKTIAGSRTPTKYKTLFNALDSKGASMKGNPETEDKKLFKTLNEIVESKHKEKASPETKKSGCRRSGLINGFELGTVLGRGKFGEVFLGRHQATGFIAAIKKIEKAKVKEFKMLEQFVQEIRLHSSLDHPNIVKFYGVFEEGESIYLVMELLNGGTLFDYLNEVACLPIREAVEYLRDVIEALSHMHDKSIAHRDIKPENIVISSEGVAKLCDFGWSAVVETSRKTYCGTFDYAPPEILERKSYDTSIDIWCIGVLTYELLTGRVPFEGDKRNVVRDKILNVRLPPRRSIRTRLTTLLIFRPRPRSSSSASCRRIPPCVPSVTSYSSSNCSLCISGRVSSLKKCSDSFLFL